MSDSEDELRRFLPSGFGKQARVFDFERQYAEAARKDYIKKDPDDSDSDDDDDELPVTHEIVLKEHTKTVSALDIDPAGMRVASGSHDYNLDLWDLGGMNMLALHPFRSVEPVEAHPVRDVHFSRSGQHILVLASSAQPKLFSATGAEEHEFTRGDMYLRDMNNTDGHVAEITCGSWHPADPDVFATASLDSTIRVWDANVRRAQKHVIVVKTRSARAAKPRVSAMAWARDGRYIAGATTDGARLYWPAVGPFNRPAASVAAAHEPDSWTSGVAYSADSTTIVTRGGDGTVKVWDTRRFKSPVLSRAGLANTAEETSVSFSPDGNYVVTGTSATPSAPGQLHVLDKSDLATVTAVTPDQSGPASVVRSLWHPKLNQIAFGTSTGAIHILFSREHSVKGAKLVIEKPPKTRHVDDDVTADIDLANAAFAPDAPDAAPAHISNLQKQRRMRKDPVKSRRPDLPTARRMDGEVRVFNYDESKRPKLDLD